MATKDLLLFKDKQNNVTDKGRYNNFTLNKNHQISSDAFSGLSKSVATERRKVLDYEEAKRKRRTAAPTKLADSANKSQTKKETYSWNKSTKDLLSCNNGIGKEERLKKGKALSGSTLSLHIEAYENANEDKPCDVNAKRLNAKQIDFDSTAVIRNPLEFPRQQGNGAAVNPEIAQYRTSQQLLNPNQMHQPNYQQPLPQNLGGASKPWGMMEDDIRDQPSAVSLFCTSLGVKFQYYLDRITPYTPFRWAAAIFLILFFVYRVVVLQGFFIVCYALFIYYLNLFLAFLTPKIDPALNFDSDDEDMPSLPQKASEEFRPFMRRLPEFKFWYATVKASLIAIFCTFFDFFDVPVFWPILVIYFFVLLFLTMKRQIMHMIRYRYIPFTTGKPKPQGRQDNGPVVHG